jgi:hypothetical protein
VGSKTLRRDIQTNSESGGLKSLTSPHYCLILNAILMPRARVNGYRRSAYFDWLDEIGFSSIHGCAPCIRAYYLRVKGVSMV